jgi:hypothetical protein
MGHSPEDSKNLGLICFSHDSLQPVPARSAYVLKAHNVDFSFAENSLKTCGNCYN